LKVPLKTDDSNFLKHFPKIPANFLFQSAYFSLRRHRRFYGGTGAAENEIACHTSKSGAASPPVVYLSPPVAGRVSPGDRYGGERGGRIVDPWRF